MSRPKAVFDDAAEFLTSAYAPLLSALRAAGLRALVRPGGAGQYLIVARPRSGPGVEVTAERGTLPPSPSEVGLWVLTGPPGHPTGHLPGDATAAALAAAVRDRLP